MKSGTDAQRRKELKKAYQEIKIYYGVIKFTNTIVGRSLITIPRTRTDTDFGGSDTVFGASIPSGR
jgi:hypothetical protein